MLHGVVKTVEIVPTVGDPPHLKETIVYQVTYRNGVKEIFSHSEWNEIVTQGQEALERISAKPFTHKEYKDSN